MEKLRYGMIGAGQMAQGHVNCIKRIPEIQIAAVADPHKPSLDAFEKLAGKEGIKYFSDYSDLLKLGEVDAVVIATPDSTHVDMACDALDAGKHVLCEKPAATTRQDLARLEEAVRKSRFVYQTGLECRYIPVFEKMKDLISKGAIGDPRMIWCHEFRSPFLHKVDDWIMFQHKTGGVFVEKTCHYFDLMTWFAGSRPKKVFAFAGQDVVKEIYGVKPDILDNGWAIIEYENGVRANLGLCMFANDDDIEIGVLGPAARMVGYFVKERIDISESEFPPLIELVGRYKTPSQTSMTVKPGPDIEQLSHGGGVYFEHLEFIDCIKKGRKPVTDINVGKWSVLVGLAAEESARSGRIVTIS